jgi:uncharacterized protein YcaQ
MHLTKERARRFLLSYQGLGAQFDFRGKPGILAFLRRVGCIQFDPLNIVGHNSDLVLQARVANYQPEMLRELLYQDRQLIDGWDKMMSIYPVEDWPYFQRWREAVRGGNGKSAQAVRAVLEQVRAAITERGPLSSLDLEMGEVVDWDWAQSRLARAALESLYFWGELVIHHKVHTRKYYDFAHRLLPEALLQAPDPNDSEEAYQDWYVRRRIGSVGLLWNRSGEAWLISSIKARERRAALERLLAQGKIVRASVAGIAEPFYFRSQDQAWLEHSLEMDNLPPRAVIMAPLDNLLWDRRLLKEMFDFDYRWEVYVPAEKRRYGYYVLPILYGDRFIARFEPGKAQERDMLAIKNWWWEAGVAPSEAMKRDLVDCFQRFLGSLGVDRLEVDRRAQEQAGLDWLADAFARNG